MKGLVFRAVAALFPGVLPRVLAGVLTGVMVLAPAVSLVSCRDTRPDLELPQTSVLVNRDSVALVSVEYARMHREPSIESLVMVHSRMGDILFVSDRTPDGQWFLLVDQGRKSQGRESQEEADQRKEGWVHRGDVALYMSEAQANNARRQLRRPGEE